MPCTTPAGEHHTKKAFLHKHALTGFTPQPTPTHSSALHFRVCPKPPLFPPDLMRVTHAHPLNPAALAFVPFGVVLVRVRVLQQLTFITMVSMLLHSCAWIGLLTSIVRTYLCQNAPGEIWITKPYEKYKQRSETPGERPKLLA